MILSDGLHYSAGRVVCSPHRVIVVDPCLGAGAGSGVSGRPFRGPCALVTPVVSPSSVPLPDAYAGFSVNSFISQ